MYLQCIESGLSIADTTLTISSLLRSSFGILDSVLPEVVSKLIAEFSSHDAPLSEQCIITELDLAQVNTYLPILDTPHARRLFLALVFNFRANFHPSGWIRYEKKNIMYLAGLDKLPVRDQESLMNQMHRTCGLNMRVIGSNNPIPCYNFTWAEVPPQEDQTDRSPLLFFGLLTPSTITSAESSPLPLTPPSPSPSTNKEEQQ